MILSEHKYNDDIVWTQVGKQDDDIVWTQVW